jgi:hypothetical protein
MTKVRLVVAGEAHEERGLRPFQNEVDQGGQKPGEGADGHRELDPLPKGLHIDALGHALGKGAKVRGENATYWIAWLHKGIGIGELPAISSYHTRKSPGPVRSASSLAWPQWAMGATLSPHHKHQVLHQ